MEIKEKEERISLVEYIILLDIFKYQIKGEFILSFLAKNINDNARNPIFQKVCKKGRREQNLRAMK